MPASTHISSPPLKARTERTPQTPRADHADADVCSNQERHEPECLGAVLGISAPSSSTRAELEHPYLSLKPAAERISPSPLSVPLLESPHGLFVAHDAALIPTFSHTGARSWRWQDHSAASVRLVGRLVCVDSITFSGGTALLTGWDKKQQSCFREELNGAVRAQADLLKAVTYFVCRPTGQSSSVQ